ncbi:MAG: ABC transporter substrate-binding protein [Muribaculaceae bacterium]|nr:ABC transporter substrate-binding protein [Muribaculaceae bacterium]
MKKLLAIGLMMLLLISCRHTSDSHDMGDKMIYKPSYSTGFKIYQPDSLSRIISIFNPWQGAEDVKMDFLISSNEERLHQFKGQSLSHPAERIVCMSSTHIAMLDAIDAIDKIVGVSGKQYVSNRDIKNKDVKDVGYEGNIDYETLVSVQPDLVLLFSINGESTLEPRLKELGIPFIYIGDYLEETPLGKTEWIVPLAAIIGKGEQGIEFFKEVEERYNNLRHKVNEINVQRPKVMVNAPFADFWYMPSTESYVSKMIYDAGGEYIYKKNTGNSSKPIDKEEALELVSQADYWINIGGLDSKNEIISQFPDFTSSKVVANGCLYNNNRLKNEGGGNDCYESGVVNPDIVLRDMIKIFHPSLIEEDFVYYHRLE